MNTVVESAPMVITGFSDGYGGNGLAGTASATELAIASGTTAAAAGQLIKENQKKITKKQEVDRVFCPDENGCSEWITREVLDANDILKWGNNGTQRHGIFFGDARYNWEKQGSHKITALRLQGYNEEALAGAARPIRSDIHAFYKSHGAACVVCGTKSDLRTDHKNDLYNDPRVLNSKTQTLEDFQCLCNHCNLQKRQISITTKQTKKRYGATNIPQIAWLGVDFIEGDETFDPQ